MAPSSKSPAASRRARRHPPWRPGPRSAPLSGRDLRLRLPLVALPPAAAGSRRETSSTALGSTGPVCGRQRAPSLRALPQRRSSRCRHCPAGAISARVCIETSYRTGTRDRGRCGSGEKDHGPRASRAGGDPEPASAHTAGKAQEVACAALPRRKQGGPPGVEGGLRDVSESLPGGSGTAQGRRPPCEIPQRLLPAGPPLRGLVCNCIAIAGVSQCPSLTYQACGGQMTSRKGEVCSARVHMKRRRFRPGDEGARCVLFRCARYPRGHQNGLSTPVKGGVASAAS